MIPQKFRSALGIKDQHDLKTANNIWKMLDEMSSNDPTAYEKFIQKNLAEGLTDAKAQKQKKQKPYKIVPNQYMLLQMQAKLEQQMLSNDQQAQFKDKLDMNINKQKWSDVKSKFSNKIHIYLNICFTDRIKNPTSKSNKGQQIKQFNISMLKDIQSLYYSLQGPQYDDKKQKQSKQQPKWYYCMIFNTNFLRAFDIVPNGKRILLGLAIAYFQQRLKNDRNPVLMKVNTHALYGKNLYYGIQKQTIEVNQSKKFKFGKQEKVCEFLLEQDVDTKQRQKKGKKQQKMIEKQKNISTSNPMKKKEPQILIKPKEQPKQSQTSQLPPLVPTQSKPNKKVLIEVLDEKNTQQNQTQDNKIPYEMKQSQDGYIFQFLVHGIEKITDLDLQVSTEQIKLKTINLEPQKCIQIKLQKKIDDNNVKAKMKKKSHTLQVTLSFKK